MDGRSSTHLLKKAIHLFIFWEGMAIHLPIFSGKECPIIHLAFNFEEDGHSFTNFLGEGMAIHLPIFLGGGGHSSIHFVLERGMATHPPIYFLEKRTLIYQFFGGGGWQSSTHLFGRDLKFIHPPIHLGGDGHKSTHLSGKECPLIYPSLWKGSEIY